MKTNDDESLEHTCIPVFIRIGRFCETKLIFRSVFNHIHEEFIEIMFAASL
jgi:hypothetical protein